MSPFLSFFFLTFDSEISLLTTLEKFIFPSFVKFVVRITFTHLSETGSSPHSPEILSVINVNYETRNN